MFGQIDHVLSLADAQRRRDIVAVCQDKQQVLETKIKLLVAYRGMIARNSALKCPRSEIKLPEIITGFKADISGISSTSLDGLTSQ
jgi:hypothetical protein